MRIQGIKVGNMLPIVGKTAHDMLIIEKDISHGIPPGTALVAQSLLSGFYIGLGVTEDSSGKLTIKIAGMSSGYYFPESTATTLVTGVVGGCNVKIYRITDTTFIVTYRTNIEGIASARTLKVFTFNWSVADYPITMGGGVAITAANTATLESETFLLPAINSGITPNEFLMLRIKD